MNLLDIVNRPSAPEPWAEGEKIPWHEPGFSQRMLQEHLSQDHDAASRREHIIDQQVAWIHGQLLKGKPTKVLDLGCGPGLYAQRLTKLGHECVGIDYSPASIAYAVDRTGAEGLRCRYVLDDIRRAEYGVGVGLVMLIFGEFNVFRPDDAKLILEKASAALDSGGLLLLEPHTFDAVKAAGEIEASWYSAESGLFSDKPHLCLEEHFWDERTKAATTRYFVVDAATGEVTRHASTMQAYTNGEYESILREAGFGGIRFYPSLTGAAEGANESLAVLVGRKESG